MKAHFSHVHWGRILLTGMLIVILVVILNTVLFVLASNVWGSPSQSEIVFQVNYWSTSILAILLIVGGAIWVARKVEREAPLHGLLVGLVAALVLFIGSSAITGAYRGKPDLLMVALLTFFLMVAAGWLGGVLGSRGRKKSKPGGLLM
jgi:putative membrane protein (TIGR04086 family)